MIRGLFETISKRAVSSHLAAADWGEVLAFADRTQLTLYLRGIPGLPAWIAAEIEIRWAKNQQRRQRLRESLTQIVEAFEREGIEFVLLKGFTHECGFGTDPEARVQYDLDLLTPPSSLDAARSALARLGYAPHGERSLSDEHLPPFVRPTDWQWRGDYYDSEMPVSVELHECLWNFAKDRIAPPGIDEFWDRRRSIGVGGMLLPALDEPDRVAFAALHVLRHILRQDARPAHVFELARFLETRASDHAFWSEWQSRYDRGLLRLALAAFRFADDWFGCGLPEGLASQSMSQSESVTSWFHQFAWSPAENIVRPNKDVLWLHLALLPNPWDRLRVFGGRLVPPRLPHRQEPAPYRVRVINRLRYHAGALTPALANGVRWWWRR